MNTTFQTICKHTNKNKHTLKPWTCLIFFYQRGRGWHWFIYTPKLRCNGQGCRKVNQGAGGVLMGSFSPIWAMARRGLPSRSARMTFICAFIQTHLPWSGLMTGTRIWRGNPIITAVPPAQLVPDLFMLFSPCPLPPTSCSATCPRKSSTKSSAWPSLSLIGWPSGRGMSSRSKPGCSRQRLYKYIYAFL